jgi:hypothetical protein
MGASVAVGGVSVAEGPDVVGGVSVAEGPDVVGGCSPTIFATTKLAAWSV